MAFRTFSGTHINDKGAGKRDVERFVWWLWGGLAQEMTEWSRFDNERITATKRFADWTRIVAVS
ncbi:hypothetical protein CATYP_07450 [Corynebacterium atypicum]|uniref:Uncharacterized protein n=1 Tax=Corynebacterium atypicum TaxID=191610 RepID=A0ABN4DG74_9CORY|nr:hypothetical protein CATYP_07450 [Corynebacterium atypicum]